MKVWSDSALWQRWRCIIWNASEWKVWWVEERMWLYGSWCCWACGIVELAEKECDFTVAGVVERVELWILPSKNSEKTSRYYISQNKFWSCRGLLSGGASSQLHIAVRCRQCFLVNLFAGDMYPDKLLQMFTCELIRWRCLHSNKLTVIACCIVCNLSTFLRRLLRFTGKLPLWHVSYTLLVSYLSDTSPTLYW